MSSQVYVLLHRKVTKDSFRHINEIQSKMTYKLPELEEEEQGCRNVVGWIEENLPNWVWNGDFCEVDPDSATDIMVLDLANICFPLPGE